MNAELTEDNLVSSIWAKSCFFGRGRIYLKMRKIFDDNSHMMKAT